MGIYDASQIKEISKMANHHHMAFKLVQFLIKDSGLVVNMFNAPVGSVRASAIV